MARWSLSNVMRPLTHEQFQSYTKEFKAAAEEAFGTACSLKIRALRSPKVYTTFYDKDIQSELNTVNRANTILETDKLEEVSRSLWDETGYVDVTINPVESEQAPAYAFGYLEFKGNLPRQATFYIQPDGEDVKNAMLESGKGKVVGDGFNSNGTRSGAVPLSIRRFSF